jgi:citrate lyase beta subunit
MRHFAGLTPEREEALFHRAPVEFSRASEAERLASSLGATLYIPATRVRPADFAKQAAAGVTSMVICLEDAVPDDAVADAEANLVSAVRGYARTRPDGPLLFVRVRHAQQICDLVARLGADASLLTGFVLPKFTELSGDEYLDAVGAASRSAGVRLLAMPVIESPEVAYAETRADVLVGIAHVLGKHREKVLALRVGGTDLCSACGLRRERELSIYDLAPVAGAIGDVVNVLGRADGTGYVITGPVWEYFSPHERLFKPRLRTTPFVRHHELTLRSRLLDADLDGLLRETMLDKANGLIGKTVIHPSHVAVVHALSVVTHEEYADASDIAAAEASGGGVLASGYANKMNEVKPHRAWARRVLARAEAFGVARGDVDLVDLLGTVLPR